jgi:general secretion pathway protein D
MVFDSEKLDMRIDRNRLNRRTPRALSALTPLAALACSGIALLALSPAGALAQSAGTDKPAANGGTSASDTLTRARDLSEQGKFVQAKALLDRMFRSSQIDALSDLERSQAMSLVKSNDSKIMTADPLEISLQKSEMALTSGDLMEAQRHAKAVAERAGVSKTQKERASTVLSSVTKRQTELAPALAGRIEQASADFEAQRYAEAKASILEVLRSGVTLTPDQASQLERQQLKIVEIENTTGKQFEIGDAAGLGMMEEQPGAVRRPGKKSSEPGRAEPLPATVASETPAPAPRQMAAAPMAQASDQPPASDTPAPAAQPTEPPPPPPPAPAMDQPAVTPPPPTSAPSSSQDDLLNQAMRAQAYALITEGDTAFDSANYSRAMDKYSLALAQFRSYIKPEDADRVQRRMDECRVRQGSALGGRDLAQQTVIGENAVRGRAQAEFNTNVKEAESQLAMGNISDARLDLATAKLSVTNAKSYFNDVENQAFAKRLAELQAKIDAKESAMLEANRVTQEKAAAEKAKALEGQRLSERDKKVSENIKRIRALQLEQKYDEALQIVDQTLFVDPNDPTALLLRDILRDMSVYKKFNDIQIEKYKNHVEQTLDNQRAMVPPAGLMDYPTDWPQKTWTRGETAAYAETPENRQVLARMNSTTPSNKIPLDLTDNRFEDVLKFVSQVTQLPIDPDWESLANVGVNKDSEVTLKLQTKVTVASALDRILQKVSKDQSARAGWAVNDGVITVASEEALRKHKVLVIYNIQDLLFQIPNYRQVPQIDLNSVLQSNQGGGGGSPFNNTNDTQQQDDPAVRQRRIQQILDIIEANVDPEGWQDKGGDTGTQQELNGSLIITNTPRNHREIVGLLSKLREIRNMQINVETKFLLVNQDWFEQIGFDIDLVFNAGNNQVTRARANDPTVAPIDFFDFSNNATVPGLQRQITGQGSSTGVSPPNLLNTSRTAQGTVPPDKLSPIGAISNSLGLTTALSEGDFATAVLKQAPALGIAGQFLDDIQVNFLVTATQADKRSVRLTAPRLTFTNGQTANIYVATQEAFISQLTPIVGDSAVGFNPQTSVLSEGVTMLIEGVISSDRRYVTMNIDSGVSRIDMIRQSPVTAIAGGQLVNSGSTQSFIELPQVTVTRVRTTSTVPDEGTLLIGGQRLITEVEVETGVPVLSKIPILNRFFTNRLETREEQSLLVLVKPTILIQTEEEEKAFPGVNDQVHSGLGLR